ncbi:MAG: ROK family protein [bacterium]
MTDSPFLLGIDLGGTSTKAILCDRGGKVLDEALWPSIPADVTVAEQFSRRVRDFCPTPPLAIGMAICGLIAPDQSTLLHAPNARPLEQVPYRAILRALFPTEPIALLNDAKAFVYAEHRCGAATDLRHVLGVTLGTGIGGGLVLDGRLYLGARGWLGEIGHIPFDPNGPLCLCGLNGCLEASCTEARLVRGYNDRLTDPRSRIETARALHDRALAGDPDALASWHDYGMTLGQSLAAAHTLLDLEGVVLGGGIAESFAFFETPLREQVVDLVPLGIERPLSIRVARLGRHAGAIGAALWALEAGKIDGGVLHAAPPALPAEWIDVADLDLP